MSYRTSGFIVLYTPLLPFDVLEVLLSGCDDSTEYEERCRQARVGVHELAQQPEVQNALRLASPELYRQLKSTDSRSMLPLRPKVEQSLVSYLYRMAGRPSLHGLMAGYSLGSIGTSTKIRLCSLAAYQRRTGISWGYLDQLATTISRRHQVRSHLRLWPNPSTGRVGSLAVLVSPGSVQQGGSRLVTCEWNELVARVTDQATDGAPIDELAQAAREHDPSCSEEEAYEIVEALLMSGFLVTSLGLPVTGDSAFQHLVTELRRLPGGQAAAGGLETVAGALADLDQGGVGGPPDRLGRVRDCLEQLPVSPGKRERLSTVLKKPVETAQIGDNVLRAIRTGINTLHQLFGARYDALAGFRTTFATRYGQRLVPLLETLDEEIGIGASGIGASAAAAQPPISSQLEDFLWSRLEDQGGDAPIELTLTPAEARRLALPSPEPLPAAFRTVATIVGGGDQPAPAGSPVVVLHFVEGPSGVRHLTRLSLGDPQLRQHVVQHLRAEEAVLPEVVHADVVSLRDASLGDLVGRPRLRSKEIPCLGVSAPPDNQTIPLDDLLLGVREGRFVLYSRRLDREVIPAATDGQNTNHPYLAAAVRLLARIYEQHTCSNLSWQWGALSGLPFLPRVRQGGVVLSLARWRVRPDEVRQLVAKEGEQRFATVQQWRQCRRLPRWITLGPTANPSRMPVDLDNPLSVEILVSHLKRTARPVLYEFYPQPDHMAVRGAEGGFIHQVIVPFVHPPADAPPAAPTDLTPPDADSTCRSFAPGGEWLYLKLYGRQWTWEELLSEEISPYLQALLQKGEIKSWHFLRFHDPDPHLRLRVEGASAVLWGSILTDLHDLWSEAFGQGDLKQIQLDTYDRELEKYGGTIGIIAAESAFCADSIAVASLIRSLDDSAQHRWELGFLGAHLLLEDFGFDLDQRLQLVDRLRRPLEKVRNQLPGQHQVAKIRPDRQRLNQLVRLTSDHAPAFQQRSSRLAPALTELRTAESKGKLTRTCQQIAAELVHMHINRLLPAPSRASEALLYGHLSRAYRSLRAARQRAEGLSP